jgi:hypothetical protein
MLDAQRVGLVRAVVTAAVDRHADLFGFIAPIYRGARQGWIESGVTAAVVGAGQLAAQASPAAVRIKPYIHIHIYIRWLSPGQGAAKVCGVKTRISSV